MAEFSFYDIDNVENFRTIILNDNNDASKTELIALMVFK